MADPIVKPLEQRQPPSLGELEKLVRGRTPQRESVIRAPAAPSQEALDIIKEKLPGADQETIDALLPRVEKMLPQIRAKRANRTVPTLETFSTPDFADNQEISTAGDPEGVGNFPAGTDLSEMLAPLGGALAPVALPATAGAGAIIATSMAGAAGGEAIFQATSPNAQTTLEDKGKEIMKAAAFEWIGAKAVGLLGVPFRMLRGNRQVAEGAAETLSRFGIKPSLQDISDNAAVEGGRRILGSFPLLNRQFRNRLNATREAFDRGVDRTLSEISPDTLDMRRVAETSLETAAEINERIARGGFEALGAGYDVMRRTRTKAWDDLGAAAKRLESSGQVGRSGMNVTALRVNAALDRMRANHVLDEEGNLTALARDGDPVGKAARFINALAKEPVDGSFSSMVGLKRRISSKIDELGDSAESVQLLNTVKEGIDEDIKVLARSNPQLKSLYDDANTISEEFFGLLGELVGRRTKQFQRGAGRHSFQEVSADGADLLKGAGPKDPISIIDTLARSGSPKEMDQLFLVLKKARGEAGAKQIFGDILGRKLSRALDGSIKESMERGADPTFAPQNFRKLMGIDDPGSPEFNATMQMFKKAGVNPRNVQDIGDVMQVLFGAKNPRVADMVARRGILGGASSVVSGLTGGIIGSSATGAGVAGPLAFLLVGRSVGKWLTKPNRAKLVLKVANASEQTSFRSRALVSILTDETIWGDETPPQAQVRQEALELLKTRQGQQQLFQAIDETFNLSEVGKRG